MKSVRIVIVVVFTSFVCADISCQKSVNPFLSDAIITGEDFRRCGCCGGLMITFNGDTEPYMGDFKLIENSADIGITDQDLFPVYVKVNWHADTIDICNKIIITQIARR